MCYFVDFIIFNSNLVLEGILLMIVKKLKLFIKVIDKYVNKTKN